ncbi:MAG: hypothetical protein AB1348_07885 [Nitrospirota bacterium]
MKVLHILKTEPDETAQKIIEEHKKGNEVTVIELYKKNIQYEDIIVLIEKSDRIIAW